MIGTHYSTDLHRYNAQRKIANLPPITAESFNQKVLERRKENTPSQTGPEKLYCDACRSAPFFLVGRMTRKLIQACTASFRKNFASGNAYENHLNSRKHKEALANPVAPREKMTVDSPTDTTGQTEPIKLSSQSTALLESAANDPSADAAALKKHLERSVQQAHFIPPLQCLFCTQTLPDLTAKVKHMHASHGFFIPDREYLVDEAGLVAYLAEVLSIWNACIYCGAAFAPPEPTPAADTEFSSEEEQLAEAKKRSRRALEAVRNHMSSKNHCKLPWDSEDERLEYSDFYDFTKSYEDDEENAGWEDVDGDGDEEHADMVVEDDDSSSTRANGKIMYGDTPFELVLPSGKRIGHRALRHIYKQNLM